MTASRFITSPTIRSLSSLHLSQVRLATASARPISSFNSPNSSWIQARPFGLHQTKPQSRPFCASTKNRTIMTEHTHLKAAELFSCKGLTAVVTGGGTGIGLMQTLSLVENGAKVIIVSRNADKLKDVAKKYGGDGQARGEILTVSGDITSKEGVQAIVKEVQGLVSGGINILINNAGVAGEGSREGYESTEDAEKLSQQMLKSEFGEWDHILTTNLTAQYFTAAAFIPLLSAGAKSTQGYASQIINTTSISGLMKGASGGQYAYAASKAAMVQMTKVLARELLPLKIRVNQIAPGIFPSEMTAGESSSETHKSDLSGSGKGEGLPAGRPGKEEDMAAATLYLASYGGVFLNGQALWPDGGATVMTPASI